MLRFARSFVMDEIPHIVLQFDHSEFLIDLSNDKLF